MRVACSKTLARVSTPATAQAAYVKDRLRERRVLVGTEGPHDNVLKIRPPMTFDSLAATRLLETLADVLAEDPAQPDWPPPAMR